jgi:hypothetical protein
MLLKKKKKKKKKRNLGLTLIQSINISKINKLNPLFCDLLIDLQRQTIKRPVSIASNVNFRFLDPISSLYSFDLFYMHLISIKF